MTDEANALVERLRDRGVCSIAQNSCRNDYACSSAADLIETQAREIERLRDISRRQDEIVKAFAHMFGRAVSAFAILAGGFPTKKLSEEFAKKAHRGADADYTTVKNELEKIEARAALGDSHD